MDAQLARFVPLHRVNKELHASIHERLCGPNANLSINGDDVHVGCATSSALLDKASRRSSRARLCGRFACSASLNASVTLQGADALRHHVGEKLPSSWIPCLPSELHHLLTSELFEPGHDRRCSSNAREARAEIAGRSRRLCLRTNRTRSSFLSPVRYTAHRTGTSSRLASALRRGELTCFDAVASGGRKRGDKRARRLHGLDT